MNSITITRTKITGKALIINITMSTITIRVILKHIKNTNKLNKTIIIDNSKIIFIPNIRILKMIKLTHKKKQAIFHFMLLEP